MDTLLYPVLSLTAAVVLIIAMPVVFSQHTNDPKTDRAYRVLISFVVFFTFIDTLWGLFECNIIQGYRYFMLTASVYQVCVAIATMLWVNYVMHYLGDNLQYFNTFSVITHLLLLTQFILILCNARSPFIFTINQDGVYEALQYRYLCYIGPLLVYIVIAIIAATSIWTADKIEDRKRYIAVFCFVLSPLSFGILQYVFPKGPYHTIGYLIGCCIINTFVLSKDYRKIKYEELEQAKLKAEAASQAKTRFLFNMSHDLRTPMSAVIGFADLLEESVDDREAHLGYIAKIRTASKALLELINHVLEMSRIEAGKTELNEKIIDVDKFLEEIMVVFEEQLKEKRLEFVRDYNVKHRFIYSDETKLKEIYVNIIGNAVKYTPEGGKITFTVTEIANDNEGYITFRAQIADNGVGMSKDFLPHIFENFSREKTTTDSKIVGTGLGMPIVKQLVDLMNGEIHVWSEIGVGSRFTVVIPHKIAEEVAEVTKASEGEVIPDNYFAGKRVLLTEDNDLNATIATALLHKKGFDVDRARNGKECLDMLNAAEEDYYHLILMDVQMPIMNGYAATNAIRKFADAEKAHIPIVAMTANAFDEDIRRAREEGMNGHISKPFEANKMFETIRESLECYND